MDQPCEVAKPARGQLSVLADASVVSTYICTDTDSTAVCICLYNIYILNLGTCTFFVHGSLLYMHICVMLFKKNLNASKPPEHSPQVEECLKV